MGEQTLSRALRTTTIAVFETYIRYDENIITIKKSLMSITKILSAEEVLLQWGHQTLLYGGGRGKMRGYRIYFRGQDPNTGAQHATVWYH